MDLFEKHFKINKFFLLTIGQWPYLSFFRKRLIQSFVALVLASCFFSSATGLIKVWGDADKMIECLPPIFTNIGCVTYTLVYILKKEKFKLLFEKIKSDWQLWPYGYENHVLSCHAEYGRIYTIVYAGCIVGTTITYFLMAFTPQILDIFLPLNESRAKVLPYPVNYYVDPNEYFYCIQMHIFICASMEACVLVGSESIFAVFTEHACGLFKIIGNHLRSVKNIHLSEKMTKKQAEDEIYRIVIFCVEQHNEAIEYCDIIESCFSICFFFTMALNSILISCTLLTVIVNADRLNEAVKYGTYSTALIIHLYFNSLPAQRLMDHSISLSDIMYDGFWYQLPLKPKKLFSMILMRTNSPCRLTAGKIVVMSLKTFCKVLQTSFSYFTLLSSLRA